MVNALGFLKVVGLRKMDISGALGNKTKYKQAVYIRAICGKIIKTRRMHDKGMHDEENI